MKIIASLLVLALLSGCTGVTKIYFYNKSTKIIIVESFASYKESVSINPKRMKKIVLPRPFGDNTCSLIRIGERVLQFKLTQGHFLNSWKQVRGGERFDIFFEYDRLYIQTHTGQWLEFPETDDCEGT